MFNQPIFFYSFTFLTVLFAISAYYISSLFKISKKKKYLAVLLTILLAPLTYRISIMAWLFFISYYPNDVFNKQEWLNNLDQRYKQIESIINSNILLNKSTTETKECLGIPDQIFADSLWGYSLGNRPGYHIDPDILVIKFALDSVREYYILCEGETRCK